MINITYLRFQKKNNNARLFSSSEEPVARLKNFIKLYKNEFWTKFISKIKNIKGIGGVKLFYFFILFNLVLIKLQDAFYRF